MLTSEQHRCSNEKRGQVGGKISRGGGRPKGSVSFGSINSQKPWEDIGISRSTYYRYLSIKKVSDV